MKIKLSLFLFYLIVSVNAQETEGYKKLAAKVPFIETEHFIERFKNDSIKREYSISRYNLNDTIYGFYSGRYVEYFKNGNIKFERINDSFGLPLSTKTYFKNGMLWDCTNTIELDTNAETIEDFLFGKYAICLIEEHEIYFGTDSLSKPLLLKKGLTINHKRSGMWYKYRNGKIIKVKMYKIIDRYKYPVGTIFKK